MINCRHLTDRSLPESLALCLNKVSESRKLTEEFFLTREKYKSKVTGQKYTFIHYLHGIALLFNPRQELFPQGLIKEFYLANMDMIWA